MSDNILDLLEQNNEFPILFIGSGISKRYLKDYPSWQGLLKEVWNIAYNDKNFYSYLNLTKQELKGEYYKDIDFEVNIRVADELESRINNMFYSDQLEINGLNQKIAYEKDISPFKKLVSNRFNEYIYKEGIEDELKLFRKMILKSQIIFTTNYDNFIEDNYNKISEHNIKKYIGQSGFFQQTPGYAEIYKIHGCSTRSNSLVITSQDYKEFEKNSILISSKIISMLLYSPIIFIGYSLKDRNVRQIIKDFSSSLTEREKNILEKRLILVERKEGEEKIIEEVNTDSDLGCRMTIIKTDNYLEVYRKVSSINQGVAPSEIRRYQHVIKKLIIDRGKDGTLDTLLMTPSELDDIEGTLKNKNLVIAIGDKTIIYKMPSIVQYMYEYISENFDQNIDVILRFIAAQQPNARLPFTKYLTDENIKRSQLHKREKEKLFKRVEEYSDLEEQLSKIGLNVKYNSLEDILKNEDKPYRIYKIIAYNIRVLDLGDVKSYILERLQEHIDNGEITVHTELRRLCLIYDLQKNR